MNGWKLEKSSHTELSVSNMFGDFHSGLLHLHYIFHHDSDLLSVHTLIRICSSNLCHTLLSDGSTNGRCASICFPVWIRDVQIGEVRIYLEKKDNLNLGHPFPDEAPL